MWVLRSSQGTLRTVSRWPRQCLWLAAAWLLLPCAALAAGRATRGVATFDRISIDQGLSHSQVYGIVQDSEGFMWFGTQGGLNRYDGYTFETFAVDGEGGPSPLGSWVRSVYQDRHGFLWVGTDTDGLVRLRPGQSDLTHFKFDPSDPRSLSHDHVQTIFQDRSGVVWVGTGGGLCRFNRGDESFTRYRHDPQEPDSLGHDDVWAIYEDRAGRLWVGTFGGGLNRFNEDGVGLTRYTHDPQDSRSLSHNSVSAIQEDEEGRLWVGTYGGGLNRFHEATQTFTRFGHGEAPTSLMDNDVLSMYLDRSGTLWVGTAEGLNEWEPETERFHRYQYNSREPTSLSGPRVYSIYQDRGDVLWIATADGLSKWNVVTGSAFPHYRHDPFDPSSLSDTPVTSFAEDEAGNLWIGTRGGGLNHFDRKTEVFTHFSHDPADPGSLSDDRVMTLLVDRQGVLWAGTLRQGLNRFDAAGGRFVHYQHDPQDPDSLGAAGVTDLHEDRNGALWVASWRGGISRWDPKTGAFIRYRHDPADADSLSSDRVIALAEDRVGALWVGTRGAGLNRFDPQTATSSRFSHDPEDPASLSHDTVFVIHESQGVLWIGTQGGGLNRLDLQALETGQAAFRHYGKGPGALPSDTVYGILADGGGNLWLSTDNGLVRFHVEREEFKNYDETWGLQGREFDFGSYYRSRSGELFFGGLRGFNVFHPYQVRDNHHKPPVVLTRITVRDEERRPLNGEIKLTHKDYRVTFEFAALDFTAPVKNRYRYKLEGFDREWGAPEPSRRAVYTSLPPRDYTFRVQGSNNDGKWSDQEVSLAVTVLPAPWKSGWAFTLYGLAAVALLLSYMRAQRRKLDLEARYSHQLEEMVEARTRELGQRNEELLLVNQRLEEASLTDSLTGLRNRRYVMGYMCNETEPRQRRAEGPPPDQRGFLFLMIDLDGLKEINDTYGHVAGDRVLIEMGAILGAVRRDSDVLCRWGGDEFLVVGRDVHRLAAETLVERIRREVANHPFDLGIGRTAELSCSIGVAFYPFVPTQPTLLSWEQVVAIADRALYAAKKSGRNAWVGILGTKQVVDWRPSELVKQINERLDVLAREDRIEILSSVSRSRSRLAL